MDSLGSQGTDCLFLKLGGSLLTDKTKPESLRAELARDLCKQIAQVWHSQPGMRLLLGIGSGSFGHFPAQQYDLSQGAQHKNAWYGVALTADSAARLVRQIIAWLLEFDLPAWCLQPGARWTTSEKRIASSDDWIVVQAVLNGLLPVVHGDVMLDSRQEVAIASTEEVFRHLVPHLRPSRILLAGEVPGVLRDPRQGSVPVNVIPWLEASDLIQLRSSLGESRGTDVTGGMAAKVMKCLEITQAYPSTTIHIFDGQPAGALQRVMLDPDAEGGTRIGIWPKKITAFPGN